MITKNYFYWIKILFLLSLCLYLNVFAPAQQPKQQPFALPGQSTLTIFEQNFRWKTMNKSWLTVSWTDPDTYYRKVRRSIDQEALEGKLTPPLIASYRTAAMQKPSNSNLQFQWAYAVYKATGIDAGFGSHDLAEVSRVLSTLNPPQSYEFTRLHFLVLFSWREYTELKPLAKRLLDYHSIDYNDYDVQLAYVTLLDGGNLADRKAALVHAKELVTKYPRSLSAYYALAGVYDLSWLNTNSDADAANTVITFEKLLAMPSASSDNRMRSSAKRIISVIEHYHSSAKPIK